MNRFRKLIKLCSVSLTPTVFTCPRRPNLGREGRPIVLRANHFQITMPRGFVHHYEISIQPDKCPRKVNREIIETMVHAYSKIFGNLKPVFDGRSNLYTRDPLPIGNDRMELEVSGLWISVNYITHNFFSFFAAFSSTANILRSTFLLRQKISYY